MRSRFLYVMSLDASNNITASVIILKQTGQKKI